MTEEEIVQIYKAFSVRSRLKIVKLIKNKMLCVNAITRELNISQPAVSQHLSLLKRAGLVKNERYGTIVHYILNRERLEDFKKSVEHLLGKEFIAVNR